MNYKESSMISFSLFLRDDLGKLKYLVQCLKESMRLYPPVPFIQRVIQKEVEIDGKILPAGTTLDVSIYNLHHNPVVWTDHMVRFSSLYDCCTLGRGPWRFVHSRGKMEPEAKPRVPFSFEGVQNPWTTVTTCNNCFVIPLYNCYSSSRSSVVIIRHYYDGLFIV